MSSNLNVVPDGSLKLPFSATNNTGPTAYVELYIDWNGDGYFMDADEFVNNIDDGATPFPTQLNFNVSATMVHQQAFEVRFEKQQYGYGESLWASGKRRSRRLSIDN